MNHYQPPCDRFIPRELLETGRAIFLLTIEYAGQTLRYSTKATTVTSSGAGTTRRYKGALPSLSPRSALDVLSQSPEAPSVSLSLIVDEPIAQWVDWGHRLESGVGELAWWVEGSTWEQRQVLIRGPLLGAKYGGTGDPLSFTLEPQLRGVGRPMLRARDVVGIDTVGTAAVEAAEGEVMPLVFGSPGTTHTRHAEVGGVKTRVTRPVAGSPAPRWTEDADGVLAVLMCYGHVSVVGNVRVFYKGSPDIGDGNTEMDGADVTLSEDARGEPVTILDVSGLSTAIRKSTEWAVGWVDASGAIAEGRAIETSHSITLTSADPSANYPLLTFAPGDRVHARTATVNVAFDDAAVTLDLHPAGNLGDTTYDQFVPAFDPTTIGAYTAPETVVKRAGDTLVAVFSPAASTIGSVTITATMESRRSLANVGPVDTLGRLISWLVARSGQRLARGEWYALEREFPQDVAGFINKPASYWEYLRDVVLPICPISLRFGPEGVYPVLWRWHAGPGRAVADLVDGTNGVVVIPEVSSARADGEVNTAAFIEYGWDPLYNKYRAQQWLKSQPDDQEDGWRTLTGDSAAGIVELAAQTYGVGRVLDLESRIIHTRPTADWVLRHKLAAEGAAHRRVQVETGQAHGYLREGDVVTLTASTLSLTSAVGLVHSCRRSDVGRVMYGVLLVEGYDAVSTGSTADKGGGYRPGDPAPQ